MKNSILFLLLWVPLGLLGQSSDVIDLTELLDKQWTPLTKGWKHKKGDDVTWAQPSYDATQWKSRLDNNNINANGDTAIAGENEIVWFRRKIKVDANFKEPIIFNIYQSGASEIYLDGKLLYTFGVVSSNPATYVHKSAPDDIFVFPLVPGKEQLLAVRYATGNRDFPLYNDSSELSIQLATIATLNSADASRNTGFALTRVGYDTFYVSLGATSLLSILFFTLFLFFPKEQINGYFALSALCMSFFLISFLITESMQSNFFWLYQFGGICIMVGLLLMLFCIYRILNRKLGFWFWTFCSLYFIGVLSTIVYPTPYVGVFPPIYLITVIILSLRSLKTNKVAALIFISCIGLIGIYFISIPILDALDINTGISTKYLSGLSFMLLPLSIAIYLGYSFSQRSKSLALQLLAVKKLSSENTKILSDQKSILEKQVTERTSALHESLNSLKATQSQLIQSEKMASLGELTAGIAHEIQNPLNFVNNFSEVSNELIDEMNEEIDKGDIEEAKHISKDIKQNLEKITHHGKRADAIVKGMLQHSRKSTAEKEPIDINKLADEYLRLAYHGLRAKDKSFNAMLETDFDKSIGKVNVIPQDMGRVILNLITNAFYATNEKKKVPLTTEGGTDAPKKTYKPTVWVSTKRNPPSGGRGDSITISVKDNGNGIPKHVVDKIFQPFFTTKPTGEGTGLGLSMSYDIVKAHGGELKVATKDGEGSVFIIHLPL